MELIELPSGVVLYYRDSDHSYWHEAEGDKGKGRITGVSTVSKALDTNADPLMTWAAKLETQGVCELLDGHDPEYVAGALADGGDALHRELIAAKLDWRSIRNRRATEGTTIHEDVFAALGRGDSPSLADVPEEIRGYGQAAFKFWMHREPKPIAVEQVVYMPDVGVAGRFDLLAEIDGEVTLVDAKTSKRAYVSHHVQLAGYVEACGRSGFPRPTRAFVLILRDNGSYELVPGAATSADWHAAFDAYTATKRISRAERELAKAAA